MPLNYINANTLHLPKSWLHITLSTVNHNFSTQALICVCFLQNVSLSIHSYLVLHTSKSVLKKKDDANSDCIFRTWCLRYSDSYTTPSPELVRHNQTACPLSAASHCVAGEGKAKLVWFPGEESSGLGAYDLLQKREIWFFWRFSKEQLALLSWTCKNSWHLRYVETNKLLCM